MLAEKLRLPVLTAIALAGAVATGVFSYASDRTAIAASVAATAARIEALTRDMHEQELQLRKHELEIQELKLTLRGLSDGLGRVERRLGTQP